MNVIRNAKHVLLAAMSCAIIATTAQATEGLAPAGPIGGSDLNQALLPPPGVYLGLVGGSIDLTKFRLGTGSSMPGQGDVRFGALGAMFVYDVTIGGGQLASTIGYGRQKLCYGIGGGAEGCSSGAMDLYTDVLMWSKFTPSEAFMNQPKGGKIIPYGTAVMAGLGVTWPTGEYDRNASPNVGSNFYTISPNVAVTHTAPSIFGAAAGRASQVSARLFYNSYSENKDSHYQTGDTVSIDFSLAEVFGAWTLGVAGSGWTQIADDRVNNVSNGIRASALNLGPVVQYDFMMGNRPAYFKAKYLHMVAGEYITQSEGLTVSVGMKF